MICTKFVKSVNNKVQQALTVKSFTFLKSLKYNKLKCLSIKNRASIVKVMNQEQGIKCWIDCDAGIDDAQGIMLALQSNVDIVGISCVHGNVDVDQVIKNVCRVLTLYERLEVPVYRGAAQPILSDPIDATYYHGSDGLGDQPDIYPQYDKVDISPYKVGKLAVLELLEASHQYKGQLVLAAIGPLTNIALACKLDPNFPERVKSLVVMGGAEHVGNITPTAEFNFHVDPEAAHMVFNLFPSTELVTWECSIKHFIDETILDSWLSDTQHNQFKTAFMKGIMRDALAGDIKHYGGYCPCDPLAIAVAIDPALKTLSEKVSCNIELHGSQTRGMSVFDNRATKVTNGVRTNVELIKDIDMDKFMEMMRKSTE
eukprot:TRINITY_DN3576_c1_g1_i1.p1 TRINITY_DN3576_c1_g1~~TRINITY_DN3576_c1_g1_i1.p1  ORF type:complete len:371 (-),score=21.40 TRINITY_DN3576_c1_g1_i1:356-1468(-)